MSAAAPPVSPAAINEMLEEHWPAARCRCVAIDADTALASLRPGELSLRPGAMISGPTQFAAADAALWFLCFAAAGRIEPLALTSDLAIRFLRPARGEVLYARASLNRYSGRSVIGSVSVWTDDEQRPTAVAQGAYVLPRAKVKQESGS